MKFIVQVKEDHGVLAIRIPRPMCVRWEIKKGDFFVITNDRHGRIRLKRLDEELEYRHGIRDGRDREDK